MAIRALVFDLFDTLVDLHMESLPEFNLGPKTLRGTHASLHGAARAHVSLEFEPFVEALGASDRALFAQTYKVDRELPTLDRFLAFSRSIGVEGDALAEALCATHMAGIRAQVKNVVEHERVLRELGRRFTLAVCSNFSHSPTALAVLEDAGLHDHFGPIVISDQNGFRKPRPEIFREVLDALGMQPDEVLHVGDNLTADVSGAGALGVRTVWVTRRVREPQRKLAEHEGPRPDHVITELKELLDVLD